MPVRHTHILSIFAIAAAVHALAANPTIQISSAKQQFPWAKTVDITYTVTGVTNKEYVAIFEASYEGSIVGVVTNALDGTGRSATATQSYATQWVPTSTDQRSVVIKPIIMRANIGKEYMIVNLETGAVSFEGMTTQAAANAKYNTNEYKTKKMVFRRVKAGTYYIGGPEDGSTNISDAPNSYHAVAIGKDYYMGIFLVTQAQYNWMLTGTDSGNSTVAVNNLTGGWNTIRGSANAGATPTTGPIANLNAKTGRVFDMPTESMWEIAARAGNSAKWVTGENDVTEAQMSRFAVSGASSAQAVGTKEANNWGFYDITGNGWQWCRDVWNGADLATLQTNGLVPITSGDSASRSERSRGWSSEYNYKDGRLSARRKIGVDSTSTMVLRLAYIVP